MDAIGLVGLIIGLPFSFLLTRSANAEAQISFEQLRRHIDDVQVVILARLDRLDDADREILNGLRSREGPSV